VFFVVVTEGHQLELKRSIFRFRCWKC